jgi:hypothetical protein
VQGAYSLSLGASTPANGKAAVTDLPQVAAGDHVSAASHRSPHTAALGSNLSMDPVAAATTRLQQRLKALVVRQRSLMPTRSRGHAASASAADSQKERDPLDALADAQLSTGEHALTARSTELAQDEANAQRRSSVFHHVVENGAPKKPAVAKTISRLVRSETRLTPEEQAFVEHTLAAPSVDLRSAKAKQSLRRSRRGPVQLVSAALHEGRRKHGEQTLARSDVDRQRKHDLGLLRLAHKKLVAARHGVGSLELAKEQVRRAQRHVSEDKALAQVLTRGSL